MDSRTLDIFLFYGHKFKYAKVNNYGRFIEKYLEKNLYQFYNSTQPLHSANNNYDLATYTV